MKSIFREHKSVADRSASDRSRHKQKINKAIREGIKDVVAEESIIGQDGKKKIRIPVKGIKEYRFVYGENEKNKKTGSGGSQKIRKGQILKKGKKEKGKGKGKEGSDESGEEYYDVEVTLDELAEYLFQDLELPDLEKKKFRFIKDHKLKRSGFRKKGMRSRLSKKETIKRKIRRKKMAISAGAFDPDGGERFPFHKDDLKYKHMKSKPQQSNSAVIFFLMDVSGSMGTDKKYMARSFYFLLYQFLRYKYENIEVVFISHSTDASEVDEDGFFKKGSTGGTIMSSCLQLEKEIISKRYHPSIWNIYTFYSGDGENWPTDDDKTIGMFRDLIEINQMVCYAEIDPLARDSSVMGLLLNSRFSYNDSESTNLWKKLEILGKDGFKKVRISKPSHIWESFQTIFGGNK
jgi:sporulation protein YhbH